MLELPIPAGKTWKKISTPKMTFHANETHILRTFLDQTA